MLNATLRKLAPYAKGYYGERIYAELVYLSEIAKKRTELVDGLAKAAADLLAKAKENGAITKLDCEATESALSGVPGMKDAAKSYRVMPIGHAHIDMNWMWAYNETVEITLETFRTILKLMDELPDFTHAQSQSSTYRIVEQYDPAMLQRIKQRIDEGRWEVSASMWVEGDKNIASGEALSRHILYTKRYMNQLFGLSEDKLQLCYEPDTFGHSCNVPEILNNGGVKYYYHCRGYDKHSIYRWKGASGASVLVYREPEWYLRTISHDFAQYVPSYCDTYGINTKLLVFGVGDHGGGPTKRDIQRLLDMRDWPLFPTMQFGTYHEYFQYLENSGGNFPTVEGELNSIFTGCYTTQTRIKEANKLGEATMYEAETAAALANKLTGYAYPTFAFEDCWRRVMFNQFHDILPGSCIISGREWCSAAFQETLAVANTQKTAALRAIASKIDTSMLQSDCDCGSMSEGAGVGFNVDRYGYSFVERGTGNKRGYTLFNLTDTATHDVHEIIVWDYQGDVKTLTVTDGAGKPLPFDVYDVGVHQYWGHNYLRLFVKARVEPFSYTLVVVSDNEDAPLSIELPRDPRVEPLYEYVLENDVIKASIDPQGGGIEYIIDKATGYVVAMGGSFRVQCEEHNGMSAWTVGRHTDAPDMFHITDIVAWSGTVRKGVRVTGTYSNSKIAYDYILDHGSAQIKIVADVDWLEVGNEEAGIPQLNFGVYTEYVPAHYLNDTPYGTVTRTAKAQDVPALTYAAAVNEEKNGASLYLLSRTKYGFRQENEGLALTLIRSAYNPDPYPELYKHHIEFAVGVTKDVSPTALSRVSKTYLHPATVLSVDAHGGDLPAYTSLLKVTNADIGAVKLCEDGSGDLLLRVVNPTGKPAAARISYETGVSAACMADINENKGEALSISNGSVGVTLTPYAVRTVRLTCK